METPQLVRLLSAALNNCESEEGRALIQVLNRFDWSWSTDDDDDDLIYEISDDDNQHCYNRYDDNASWLWQQFTTNMRLAFERAVTKHKRGTVGKARLTPFPDKRSPTPAA